MEIETDGKIPFLDVLLIRESNHYIKTDWFSKPTSANNILNYLSSHPHHQKMNVACNLSKRILQLSHHTFHEDNTNKIKNILTKNNYPKNIINKILHKVKHQLEFEEHSQQQTQNNSLTGQEQQQLTNIQGTQLNNHQQLSSPIPSSSQQQPQSVNYYNPLTYIPSLSDKIARLITNTNPEAKLAFQPTKTIKNNLLTNMKQKVHKLKQSEVVYKIDCADDNCRTSYIGETKRTLEIRKKEHERDYRNRFLPSPKTGLINHTLETGHQFDFQNIAILDKEANTKKRRIIESAHIVLNSPHTCNLKQDTSNLHSNYHNTLNSYRSISPKHRTRPPDLNNPHNTIPNALNTDTDLNTTTIENREIYVYSNNI